MCDENNNSFHYRFLVEEGINLGKTTIQGLKQNKVEDDENSLEQDLSLLSKVLRI